MSAGHVRMTWAADADLDVACPFLQRELLKRVYNLCLVPTKSYPSFSQSLKPSASSLTSFTPLFLPGVHQQHKYHRHKQHVDYYCLMPSVSCVFLHILSNTPFLYRSSSSFPLAARQKSLSSTPADCASKSTFASCAASQCLYKGLK